MSVFYQNVRSQARNLFFLRGFDDKIESERAFEGANFLELIIHE